MKSKNEMSYNLSKCNFFYSILEIEIQKMFIIFKMFENCDLCDI